MYNVYSVAKEGKSVCIQEPNSWHRQSGILTILQVSKSYGRLWTLDSVFITWGHYRQVCENWSHATTQPTNLGASWTSGTANKYYIELFRLASRFSTTTLPKTNMTYHQSGGLVPPKRKFIVFNHWFFRGELLLLVSAAYPNSNPNGLATSFWWDGREWNWDSYMKKFSLCWIYLYRTQ